MLTSIFKPTNFIFRIDNLRISFLFVVAVLFACKPQARHPKSNETISVSKTLKVGDSILVDLNTYPNDVDSIVSTFTTLIGLRSMSTDSNFISIRVWCELNDTVNVIALEMSEKESTGSIYSFGFKKRNGKDFLYLYDKNEKVQPSMGWKSLLDSTLFFKVLDMPSQSEVVSKKKIFVEGGDVFTFQISRNGQNRSFQYTQPGAYKNDNWQSRNIYSFLKLIEREFRMPTHSFKLN